jgi:hypothetical protein
LRVGSSNAVAHICTVVSHRSVTTDTPPHVFCWSISVMLFVLQLASQSEEHSELGGCTQRGGVVMV